MADFAEALARAKELAAKFSNPAHSSSTNGSGGGLKRSADSYGDSPPSAGKRMNFPNDKVAQAAEIAARLNEKLGGPTNPSAVIGNAYGVEGKQTVVHKVPDGYVGLIIGKKGEQITRIQRETGCTVQIAPDSGGLPDRSVTLTGSPDQIDAVKKIFSEIINNARPNPGPGGITSSGQHIVEVSVPGARAGLIIGKNGETIKQLQEQTNTKMVLIQETNAPTEQDKPLRITGDYAAVEKAKQMVIDLLNSKGTGAFGNRISYDYPVPAEKAGLVIGRGGETIKDISRQSGARLEIQKQPPPNPNLKIFTITGEQSQIDHAIRLIADRINVTSHGHGGSGGGGGGYGGGSAYGGGGGGGGGANYYGADPYAQNAWSQSGPAAQWGQGQAAAPAAGGTSSPGVNPQTGQPDYTAAWVEYYRRQGMHEQANAILRMSQTGAQSQGQPQSGASQQQPQGQPQTTDGQSPNAGAGSGGGYDYAQQWAQYQQWQQQQYSNAAAAWGQQGQQGGAPGTGGSNTGGSQSRSG